ncbi:MAG TPA: HAMP domain-containing sensor histidine kinase [Acidimicrobiia bacterium]|nr:HAMP domain-containing sensor histidine kinase [Acidimicrobiia bacterium]
MRRLLLASTLTIVVAILLLFGVPLGIVLDRAVHADAQSRLQREASRVAREVGLQPLSPTHPNASELVHLVSAGDVAIVKCDNPRELPCAPGWPNGKSSNVTKVRRPIKAIVTLPGGTVVVVESPSDTIDTRVAHALLALVLLGTAALAAALGLALIQSRRLADPLARLARSATRLGDGDFSLSTPRSGVPEIDAIASSLDRSAMRVEELLRAERSFSTHASHQLRTALTGLQLRIEELAGNDSPEVREEAEAALEQSARLLSIIEELLALARTGRAGNVSQFELGDLVRQHVDDVEPILGRAGRRAVVIAPKPVPVMATLGAVGQVLDILLSNALRHGAGRVTATVSADERHARVDIADEGKGITDGDEQSVFVQRSDSDGHGIGLALAHTLITTEGGTITLLRASPPVFRIELPVG